MCARLVYIGDPANERIFSEGKWGPEMLHTWFNLLSSSGPFGFEYNSLLVVLSKYCQQTWRVYYLRDTEANLPAGRR